MKKLFYCCILMLAIDVANAQPTTYAILPKPVSLNEHKGTFTLTRTLTLTLEKDDVDTRRVASQLADQ